MVIEILIRSERIISSSNFDARAIESTPLQLVATLADAMLSRENDSMDTIPHFIAAEVHVHESPDLGDVYNPATGELARKVCMGGAAEVDAAAKAASEAFPEWAATPPLARARVMFSSAT